MNKMTPEYAEALAVKAGCSVSHLYERGVEWLIIKGSRGAESVAIWSIFQMTEADFRKWHLERAA